MAKEFELEILTPLCELVKTSVSEVVVPSHDGERGILANHEDFVGLLGTGALKMVENGDDYWFMVSSGVLEVSGGKVKVLAEVGEEASQIDPDQERARAGELEKRVGTLNLHDAKSKAVQREFLQAKARIEVHRRTQLVN